jgi:hypothetical protein
MKMWKFKEKRNLNLGYVKSSARFTAWICYASNRFYASLALRSSRGLHKKVAVGQKKIINLEWKSEVGKTSKDFDFSSFFFFSWVRFSSPHLPNEPLVQRCMYVRNNTEKKIICSAILSHEFSMNSCSQSSFTALAWRAKEDIESYNQHDTHIGHCNSPKTTPRVDFWLKLMVPSAGALFMWQEKL